MFPKLPLHGACVQLALFHQSIELNILRSRDRRYESSMAFGMRKALQVTSRVKPERQNRETNFQSNAHAGGTEQIRHGESNNSFRR